MKCLDVEIVMKNHSSVSREEIIKICTQYLTTNNIICGTIISKFDCVKNFILYETVRHIIIGELNARNEHINIAEVHINWYVYTLDINGPQNENCELENGEVANLSTQYILPSQQFFTLWENLVYESKLKENLLNYAQTMMEFSDAGVNTNVISCNRVILLHGPPGTGKTSLCKALAQKLSIKMQQRFKHGILVEINAHSLFSKWFSESGKLVTKMFMQIKELVEDSKMLVCVLIDEIESLAHARQQCLSGNEPSDSVRVVNAVLTQIDQIKHFPNVIIFTTSNMTCAIDVAFVDRADVKQYLGLPTVKAIYQIFESCIKELLKTGIIYEESDTLKITNFSNEMGRRHLIELCQKCEGLSGRTLRRIPFLAHALFIQNTPSDLGEFLDAMSKAIDHEWKQLKLIS